jgi:3-hydroxyacyl-[acyl-carrier-protein] dehydratase
VRFLFYDRVTRLEKGVRIEGVKTFALSEEYLRGHFPRRPVVPGAILIEAMAQLLGWGVIYAHDFRLSAIMSLVEGFTLHEPLLRPGGLGVITGEIVTTTRRDSLGRAWIDVDGRRVATLDRIIYSHFRPVDSEAMLRWFQYYSGWSREQALPPGGAP